MNKPLSRSIYMNKACPDGCMHAEEEEEEEEEGREGCIDVVVFTPLLAYRGVLHWRPLLTYLTVLCHD